MAGKKGMKWGLRRAGQRARQYLKSPRGQRHVKNALAGAAAISRGVTMSRYIRAGGGSRRSAAAWGIGGAALSYGIDRSLMGSKHKALRVLGYANATYGLANTIAPNIRAARGSIRRRRSRK